MAFSDNPFGGGPFGQGPFGPRPSDEQPAAPNLGWFRPFDRAVAVSAIALIVGGSPFIPREATIDNTTNVVWPLTQGEKARPIARVAPQGHHLFVPRAATLENTTNTVWPLTFGERARQIPRAPQGTYAFGYPYLLVDNYRAAWDWFKPFPDSAPQTFAKQGHHLFVPRTATIDNTTNTVWPLTQGEKARPIPRIAPQGAWVFGYPYEGVDNTRDAWDWTIKWPDRFPQTFWKGKPYQPFVPREATRENTTNVVWPLTQGEKARPVPRQAKQGHHLFVPRAATLENTTNTVWPLTQGQTARPIPRAPLGMWVLGYPYESQVTVTPTDWDWQIHWPRAVEIPRTAPQGMWAFGFPYAGPDNNVTPDKWLVHWRGPPRSVPPYTLQPTFFVRRLVGVTYEQAVNCQIELTVDFHICGWSNAAPVSDAFVAENEQSDVWSEQEQSDDDYDEQDECGR